MTSKKLTATLILGIFIVAGLLVLFSRPVNLDEKVNDTIRFEIIKALLELLVIIIIGGIIAQLFKAAEFNRQQAQVFLDLRMEFLKRLGMLYNAGKSIRRQLRIGGLSTKFVDNPELNTPEKKQLYIEQMKLLNEVQLNLEELKREAQSSPAVVTYKNVSNELKKMEDYLRQILNEYAHVSTTLLSGRVAFSGLERLNEFTCSTRQPFIFKVYNSKTDYRFKTHFSQAFDKIIETFTS